jgi:hypothetical protein
MSVGSGRLKNLLVTGTFSRPADNVAYAAGDHIANSTTAASVVPITFANATRVNKGTGRITGARCTVAPASGNVVITNFAFDLLLFRPATGIPFAAAGYPADNAALNITAAAYRQLIGQFKFLAANWRNQAGGLTAGTVAWQDVGPGVPVSATVVGRLAMPFSLAGLDTSSIIGVVQAQGAWTPTGIVNQFDFALDIEAD